MSVRGHQFSEILLLVNFKEILYELQSHMHVYLRKKYYLYIKYLYLYINLRIYT